MVGCLAEGNQGWARNAAALVITVARTTFSHNGKPNRHAYHDIGLAVGNLSVQATAMGLSLHQMAGFDPARAKQLYSIPDDHDAVTAIALGYRGNADSLPGALKEREAAPRERKELSSFVFKKSWDSPVGF